MMEITASRTGASRLQADGRGRIFRDFARAMPEIHGVEGDTFLAPEPEIGGKNALISHHGG